MLKKYLLFGAVLVILVFSLTAQDIHQAAGKGDLVKVSDAFFKFSDAFNSPSDLIITPLFSLSASACLAIILFCFLQ